MKKLIVGQIIVSGKVMGTGFLVGPDVVLTVKHNIINPLELVQGTLEEKDVLFHIEDGDDVSGKTINLLEAIERRIDCVFIRLNEILSEDEICDVVDVENDIKGSRCNIFGFPKLVVGKKAFTANVVDVQEEELVVTVNKEDQLQNYEGLSGAPLSVMGNIVGVIEKQENSERLKALPIKYIKNVLSCSEFSIKTREVPVHISCSDFNFEEVKKKNEQVISMAGPRYNKVLNVKTSTYNNLMFMLRKDGLVEHIKDLSSQIKDCMKWLQEFDSSNRTEENLVLQENRASIESVITELQNIYVVLDNHSFDENKYKQILEFLCKCEQELRRIFDIEKTRFEEKYGAGTYDNKSWRGFQASYMCEFPAQYLDEIRKVFLSDRKSVV